VIVEIEEKKIPFISLDMLIKNKLSTKRGKDKVDAEILQKRIKKTEDNRKT